MLSVTTGGVHGRHHRWGGTDCVGIRWSENWKYMYGGGSERLNIYIVMIEQLEEISNKVCL